MPYGWRDLNRFLTLQIGDTAGECATMVCVLKLLTTVVKGNRFGVNEGEEVLTLRPKERGTQKWFVNAGKILRDEMWAAVDG